MRRASAIGFLCILASGSALAQKPPTEARLDRGLPESLQGVGIEQNLDAQLPLDVALRDETGREITLSEYFGKRPVVLVPAYYTCRMLCNQVLRGTANALGQIDLDIGEDYEVVTVSFDPRDTPEQAAASKRGALERFRRSGGEDGWHFLTGDAAPVRALLDAAGYTVRYDESIDQYAHASGIIVVTPQGRTSRYFYGVEYSPRDVRLGLVDASAGKIGTVVDKLFLYCYQYNPSTGKYGAVVMRILRLSALATVAAILLLIVVLGRRYRSLRLADPGAVPR